MNTITLRAARVNAGMRQDDVAKRLNISSRTLSNWENGKTCPRMNDLRRLCELYGIPVDAIILP